MNDEAMSPLRRRMIEDMTIRNVGCDPSRFIHRHLLCRDGFVFGRAAIDIRYSKTICVPHHVAAGKFLGMPWGRQPARHFICPIAHGAWTEPRDLSSSSMAGSWPRS